MSSPLIRRASEIRRPVIKINLGHNLVSDFIFLFLVLSPCPSSVPAMIHFSASVPLDSLRGGRITFGLMSFFEKFSKM